MSSEPNIPMFSASERTMLGKTADALSAYLGAAVLAEIGTTDGVQWVIFGRALGEQDEIPDDAVRVQLGGMGSDVLGQKGGLATDQQSFDCTFLWAIEVTDDEAERFIRLDSAGEVFDSASQLADLLPFSLEEPVIAEDDDLEDDDSPDSGDGDNDGGDRGTGWVAPGNNTRH
jgi:hypothetical protein